MIGQKTITNKIENKTRIRAAEAHRITKQTNNDEGRAKDLQTNQREPRDSPPHLCAPRVSSTPMDLHDTAFPFGGSPEHDPELK
jgi:hypothetical protein